VRKSFAVAAAVLLLSAGAALAKPRRVFTVSDVTAKLSGNQITVDANGSVRTGGWTAPKLVRISRTSSTLTFSFEAMPPTGIVTQMITPIAATVTTGPLRPPFPTKVKVVAETNSKTVKVTK
jgi:hypothetical protein